MSSILSFQETTKMLCNRKFITTCCWFIFHWYKISVIKQQTIDLRWLLCVCQVRDEYRTDYDSGRGGYGKLVKQKLQINAWRMDNDRPLMNRQMVGM